MPENESLTDDEIKAKIKADHAWGLKSGVLLCFGINPDKFDLDNPANGNTNPRRVYNHCCKILDDGSRKLDSLKDGSQGTVGVRVLRDDLIKFCFKEWPDFTKRTHGVWQNYKKEKGKLDAQKPSALRLQCIQAYDNEVLLEFAKNKQKYLSGERKKFNKSELARRVVNKNPSLNSVDTVRSYAITRDIQWATENTKST